MSEPSLDRTRLSGHQGHHSCALRKTGTEARKPGRSAHCDRQSPGMDHRQQARPQSGTSRSGPRFFGVRSGGEPAPSLDMAEVSQRSATGSRSSEGSILTRRDAPPDFLVSAIIRAMDVFMRGCNYSVGGCPGRCDRLPHWELCCPRFRWVTFNRGRRLVHEAFWLPGH